MANQTIFTLDTVVTKLSVDLNIFMNKLAKINPKEKMVGEVEYWSLMSSILK